MRLKKVSRFLVKAGSLLVAGAALGLAGCGAESIDFADPVAAPELGEAKQALTGGWTTLTLRNGWRTATNSNTPAVGIVNGIVTFRGALDGTLATSPEAFCLTAPVFTTFRPIDVGYVTLRTALANGKSGSAILSIDSPNPEEPGYCMTLYQDDPGPQPGPDARIRTSLEGVSYDKTLQNSVLLDLEEAWAAAYPSRGSDGSATGNPAGQGAFAKLVNGFVRFQGVLSAPQDSPFVLFTLPTGQGMIPGKPVYVPVTLCALSGLAGRIVIQTNGQVIVEGSSQYAWCGVSLDGAAYSMSSPASAQPISLSSGWVAHSTRAVRARVDGGAVRLEGAVKNGTTTTIGTLPTGMRPARTIHVVANALQFAQPATLSISSVGTIRVVSPALVAAQPGISLDGVSFGL